MSKSDPLCSTDVALPESLVSEAHRLHVDVSQACERGLRADVAAAKARQWQEENQAAIDAWNLHVEQNGVPLAEYRTF